MLSRQANHALRALLELAAEPAHWRSTHELARAQQLPEPMLEQILLRLRRAGLLVARRGRIGGFRLAMTAEKISIATVLAAVEGSINDDKQQSCLNQSAIECVTTKLQRHIERAQQRALEQVNLEELLFDLQSAEAGNDADQGLLFC